MASPAVNPPAVLRMPDHVGMSRRSNTSIPILMYHQVTPHPLPAFRKYGVTPRAFAAQINWLTQAGYKSITLDALLAFRRRRTILPSRPVIITFDDGFQDCVDYAVPILQAHAFTATFYLVAGLMGKTSRWLVRERGIELPLMHWSTARRLAEAGFDCGAHTMSHPHLAELSPSACRDELLDARCRLADHLGQEVRHMAYPYGSFNDSVRRQVAETGYHSACSVRIGISAPDDDPLALHRVPVTGQDSLLDFISRLRTTAPLHGVLRGAAQHTWRRLRGVG